MNMTCIIAEYAVPERITSQMGGRAVISRPFPTHAEAVAEVHRLLNDDTDNWKVRGYNEEKDYYWARNESPVSRTRVLRVEKY
ncbi:hypothetical protein LKMONMHP_4420 [Methylobacterium organophilum]|uniref:Uncharacterized protein n=2 Tax=Methylobacterium organophilum TaxID=410 RepID=A0ABQ4TD62_METOR|nr:hypothetical protein LKMONMHP_4420 [Methylobacterium organophilum]